MALNPTAMASAIQAQLDTAFPDNTPSHAALALAIATAVIAQITSTAVVNSTGIGNLGAPVVSVGTIS